MIKEIYKILEEVRNTSSTNQKEQILLNNKENETLKKVLEFTYNPHKKYGVSDRILNKTLKGDIQPIVLEDPFAIYEKLASNNINDSLREEFASFILGLETEEEKDTFKKIAFKDLKLGLGKTTINKIWPGVIPTAETGIEIKPMLASKLDFNKLPNDEFVITEKLDGIRCMAILKEDSIQLFSRQGKLIEGCKEVEEDLKLLREKVGNEFVLDGELIAKDCGYDTVYKETTKRVKNKNEIKTGIKFVYFDILNMKDFENLKCETEYFKRLAALMHLNKNKFENIEMIKPLYTGSDIQRVIELSEEYKRKGAEGLMMNLYNGVYEFKRSKNILKVKSMQDADLRVVGYEEGTGKNEGKLGAIIVEFEHKGNIYTCRVGSGFSDYERNLYWHNIDLIMGKIVTIQFFEITNNSNGGYGLRFPVWTSRIRNEKTEISMN